MEQITRKDGVIYYGEEQCESVDDAYSRFRKDYHEQLGRQVYKRLDRIGQRTERIHESGFCFADGDCPDGHEFSGIGRIPYTLGLVAICYCRMVGLSKVSWMGDEQFDRWFDWAFSKGSGVLKLVGRKDKSGRTSKRLNARYR